MHVVIAFKYVKELIAFGEIEHRVCSIKIINNYERKHY